MRQVNVDIAPEAKPEAVVKALSALPGVLKVSQVFPGSTDDGLRLMYVVEITSVSVAVTLRSVEGVAGVELVPWRSIDGG